MEDKNILSVRKRTFSLFDQGKRPAAVVKYLGKEHITLATACRYFADWKKLPGNLNNTHRLLRKAKARNPKLISEIAKSLSLLLSLPEKEIIAELQKPWALNRIANGKFLEQANKSQMQKLANALKFLELYEIVGVPIEKIAALLDKLEAEARRS